MRNRNLKNALDNVIARFYTKHGQNVQIDILDIPNIYKMGKEAAAKGESVEQAIIMAIAKYRKN